MNSWRQDLRQDLLSSARGMRRNPGLSAIVVLSLGLAIGVNTAVFSVVRAFLLRPLITDIEHVVRVREAFVKPGQNRDVRSLSAETYLQWQRSNRVFDGIAAAFDRNATLTGGGEPERLAAEHVTANFFPVLGVLPMLGRNFLPEEDRPGRPPVVILSHALWSRRFGADRGVLGRAVLLDGRPHTVIGVMPRGFRHPWGADVWVPAALVPTPAASPNKGEAGMIDMHEIYAPARLKPGISRERAEADMTQLAAILARESPRSDRPTGAKLIDLRWELLQGLDKKLLLLAVAAGFVLLIACGNISNLLLARSLGQEREVAVRTALGATRWRLFRQLLTSTLVLALAGGGVGLVLTRLSLKSLVALAPVLKLGEFDIEPRLDWSILGFTFLVSALVGVLCGLAPAVRVSQANLGGRLREEGRSSGTMGRIGLRLLNLFVVAEVALAVILLVGAGLVTRSFEKIRHMDRGFDASNLLTFKVSFPANRYPEERQKVAFIADVVGRLAALPGVTAAGATTTEPLYTGWNYAAFQVQGHPAWEMRGYHMCHHRTITPSYLAVMKIPLLQGRNLTEQDNETSEGVVLVSRSFAQHYWPGESALGKQVKRGRTYESTNPWLTVVGVVGDVQETPDYKKPEIRSDAWYFPYRQTNQPTIDSAVFAVRASSEPRLLVPAVRDALLHADPNHPIYDLATMEQRIAERTRPDELIAVLYGTFGVIGLVLSVLGLHGVLSFAVNQRQREIGIRSAMGARPRDLSWLILGRAMTLTALGLGAGVLCAFALSRYLAAQLHEISAADPLTYVAALAVLTLVSLLSSYLPARRAAKVDPVRALRYE